ncbi:MAG: transglutaminase [Sneathiella sp.]|nr:MAG: transglutaminase [Sneathiella sp.]
MRLKISHMTRYQYDAPVQYALQQVRLTPKSRAGQSVISWETTIEGGSKELEFDDQHNNHVFLVGIEPGGTEISILCEGEVETTNASGVIGKHGGYAPLWLFKRETDLTKPGKNLRRLIKEIGHNFNTDIPQLHALSAKIAKTVRYQTGSTHAETTVEEALEAQQGVCQDHSHIFIAAARLMGFPARYVSGYLMMDDRIDQDASHAWAEVHIEGIGWVGFDVSNGISPDERYIRVATGLDYKDAAPISGMRIGNSGEIMSVSLQVQQQ